MKTEIKVDTNYLSAFIDVKKKIREAQREALYQVGIRAKEDTRKAIAEHVDRPIKYTLNAPYSTKAKVSGAEAKVEVAYNRKSRGANEPQNNYLNKIVLGTRREHKRSELRLMANGLLGRGQYIIPTALCPMDNNGNVKRGLISQMLAYMQTFKVEGGRRRNINLQKAGDASYKGPAYFFGWTKNKRSRMIFMKVGDSIKPIFLVVNKQPQYKAILPFYNVVEQTFDREFEKLYVAEFNLKMARSRAIRGI